jgi:eukaryotic-like serine/threonine-protein kinase
VFSARWTDWLTYVGGGLLLLVLLYAFGWFWYWLAFAGVAVGLAFLFAAFIDRRVRQQRKEPLEKLQGLLRTLRLKGLDEAALQQFVAHFSGKRWEEFFEALFGYEAKLKARESLLGTEAGKWRQKFRAWRDPLVRWIDEKLVAKRDARDRKLLQKVEEKSLEAQGIDLLSARRQAQRVAEALIDNAADARTNVPQNTMQDAMNPAKFAELKRLRVKAMLAEARAGKYEAKRARQFRTAASPIAFLFGPKVRFLLGCLLLAGCGLWARQNGLFTGNELKDVTQAVVSTVKSGDSESLKRAAENTAGGSYQSLGIPFIGPLVSSFSAGLAGVMLIVLSMFRGWKMSIFALPAAAIMVLGPTLPLPDVGLPLGPELLSLAAGGVLCVLGLLLGRTKAD